MQGTQPTPKDEMAAFDQLPVTVRRALANSGEQFSASQVYRLWRSGEASARELVEMIQGEDKERRV